MNSRMIHQWIPPRRPVPPSPREFIAISPLQFAQNPESEPAVAGVRVDRQPRRGTRLFQRTGPGGATRHALRAPGIDPGRSIRGRTLVTVVPAVGDPFRDIADHVEGTPGFGGKTAYRRRPPEIIGVAGDG